jgi:integrase
MKPTRYPGILMLDKNSYRIRLRVIDPKTGKLKEVDRQRDCTLAEAVALQAEWRNELEDGGNQVRQRVKLQDYARSWLAIRLTRLKPSTARRYAEILDLHIVPGLGEIFLDALAQADITGWMMKEGKQHSPRTVGNFLRVLRALLRDAVAELELPRDPCARVKPPRAEGYSEEAPNLLAPEELRMLLHVMETEFPEWYALTLTLAYTGLRWGEATALKWSDVDKERGVIWVRRSNWFGQIVETKTGKKRSVGLPPQLGEVLEDRRRKTPPVEGGWVFATKKGELIRGSTLGKPLQKALQRAGITHNVTPHGLRRTFNNLARQVVSGEVVRAITGHSTVAMTEHYSHVDAAEKRTAALRVIDLVSGGSSGGSQPKEEAAIGKN